jgi:hypothetical protein
LLGSADAELVLESLDCGEIRARELSQTIRGAQISDFGARERALLLERRQQVRGQRLVLVEQPRELLLLLGAADAGMIEREPSRRRPLEVARFSDWPWESGSQ